MHVSVLYKSLSPGEIEMAYVVEKSSQLTVSASSSKDAPLVLHFFMLKLK